MPELPEVETIRRVLEPQLQNRTIEKVTVNHKDAVAYPSVDDFCLGLTGQMVSHIQRRGKFLIICMKSGDRVILHLRMTGGLLFTPKNYPEEKYTHLIFHFDQGQKLLFSDMRRFGRFWFLKKEEKDTFSGIAKLGIEPFDPKLSADYLKTYLGTRKKAIKTCLLDQSIIAGIGNIYSDEILFAVCIFYCFVRFLICCVFCGLCQSFCNLTEISFYAGIVFHLFKNVTDQWHFCCKRWIGNT